MGLRSEIEQDVLEILRNAHPKPGTPGLSEWTITMFVVDTDGIGRWVDRLGPTDDRVFKIVRRVLKSLAKRGFVEFFPMVELKKPRKSVGYWRRLSLLEQIAVAAQ